MRYLPILALLALSACEDEPLSPEEQRARDERDIAMVEEANRAAAPPIAPEPILYPDIEANGLYGTGCSFVAEGSGLGAVMLAMIDNGYMKLDGDIVRFAADKGSPELPFGARRHYAGKKYAFELALAPGEGRPAGMESVNYDGRLTVREAGGAIVYDKSGTVQCGS